MIEEIIEKIIKGRIDVSGSALIYTEIFDEDGNYIDDLCISDEIEQALQEKGIKYSIEMWQVLNESNETVYGLSVAWIEDKDEELRQYCTTLRSF